MKRINVLLIIGVFFSLLSLSQSEVFADEFDCTGTYSTCSVYLGPGQCEGSQFCGGAVDWCRRTYCEGAACPECDDTCGCTGSTGCTPPPCPEVINNSVHDYELENFVNCNSGSSYRSCYEYDSTQPVVSVMHVSDSTTDLGFSYVGRTGSDLNHPNSFKVTVTDVDGADDIEAFYVWFSDSGSPTTSNEYLPTAVGGPILSVSDTSFGLMYHLEGTDWVPYNFDTASNSWVRYVGSSFNSVPLFNSTDNQIAVVEGVSVTNVLNGYEVVLRVYPEALEGPMSDGKYDVYVQANDVFSFTPIDNYPELDGLDPAIYASMSDYFNDYEIRFSDMWVDSATDWFVDLTDPTINTFEVISGTGSNLVLDWEVNDNLDVSKVVINAFGSSDLTPSVISYGGHSFTPDFLDDDTYRGVIGHTKSFSVDYPARPLSSDTVSDSITVDIGDNKGGSLIFVITVFDSAGNNYQSEQSVSLEDWLITKGNFVYSSGGIGFDIKSLSGGLWSGINTLSNNGFESDKADISTELYGGSISGLIHAGINDAYGIASIDTSSSITNYSELRGAFINRIPESDFGVSMTLGSTLTGNLCNSNCSTSLYYGFRDGDLDVDNNFVCNGKSVVFVDGNLTIDPDIDNVSVNRDACIFVVSGDVNVTSGDYHSTSGLEYDQLNALIIADGVITLESDGGVSGSRKDGLYINGGVISNSVSPIEFDRFLRLDDKALYPAVVIDGHEKYRYVTKVAFGSKVDLISVEVGFKPG